jgi:hypothetical protein
MQRRANQQFHRARGPALELISFIDAGSMNCQRYALTV